MRMVHRPDFGVHYSQTLLGNDVLQQVVLLIEEHYSGQIHHHYQQLSHHDLFDPPIVAVNGTAPF
jgi:hypothetical protein